MATITNINPNKVTSTIDVKAFYTSKTFWAGIVSIITGISIIVQNGGQVTPAAISAFIVGIGTIFGRSQATGPIGLSSYTTVTDVTDQVPVKPSA